MVTIRMEFCKEERKATLWFVFNATMGKELTNLAFITDKASQNGKREKK